MDASFRVAISAASTRKRSGPINIELPSTGKRRVSASRSVLPAGLDANRAAGHPHAYVTLVTNPDYALGARALVRSLLLTGTAADCVVLHTGGVSRRDLAPLAWLGARLVHVDLLPTSRDFNDRHARRALHRAAPFDKGGKPLFHTPLDNFAKLRLWQLVDYEALVFIDADAIILRNCDDLFERTDFNAAPNVYESVADMARMNSGVFTARPSPDTFFDMLNRLDQPDVFWRRTDQTFLQDYFPDWAGLPMADNMLQYVWFALPHMWDWRSIRVVHYQYEKPWQDGHDKAHRLQPLIDLWRAYAGEGPVPDLSTLPAPPRP